MKIAVEGCAHGELEKIYETIQSIEKAENLKVDLLLCCGDFQATRNLSDLQTMAVPRKFQDMCSFYKYYSGEKVAPILTIFIGGNHEASNYLQELPYGGWVAPNIYYMGYAGIVRVNGVRIGGISGIYKGHDFLRGHYEFSPYSESTKRSVYHVRQLEVFRLKQLSGKIDIFMSHDWPRGIYNYGNKAQLIRFKPHFRDEVENNQLGSRPCEDLLKTLKPTLWFAAHLHCKFAAVVQHDDENNDENAASEQITKFLALDKCLPRRRFLQLTDFECVQPTEEKELKLEYDLEWLTILYLTNHLINVKNSTQYMPGPNSGMTEGRYEFTPTNEEMEQVRKKFGNDLRIPQNFCRTVEPYNPNVNESNPQQPKSQINPQSTEFCDKLGIDDPLSLAMLISGHDLSHSRILDDSDLNNSSKLSEDLTSQNSSTCETAQSIEQSPTQHKNNTILNLPKPISERCSISCSSPKLLDLPAENTSNPDELNLDDIPENYTEEDETIKDETENVGKTDILEPNDALNAKPPIKKFKRRNENIYKTEEEE